jgi:hypothetical protein
VALHDRRVVVCGAGECLVGEPMTWFDAFNYLNQFQQQHPNSSELTAQDMRAALELYIKMGIGPVEQLLGSTQVTGMARSAYASVTMANHSSQMIVQPLMDNCVDLIIIQQSTYSRFRNIAFKQSFQQVYL